MNWKSDKLTNQQKNQIWEEACKSETANLTVRTDFSINSPKNCEEHPVASLLP